MVSGRELINRSGWRARLKLEFGPIAERTVLVRREHFGPLAVQRPFHPGDGVCHAYLLHPPGGVAGGDSLDVDVRVHSGAAALVTTPAAAKIYRTLGAVSAIRQTLLVEEGASLEWLPQETILFGGSNCRTEMDVRLEAGARFVGWEVFALGREHSGDHYRDGAFRQCMEVRIGGELKVRELHDWQAGDPVLTARWGLASARAFGTLYAVPADRDVLARARKEMAENLGVEVAATLLDDILAVRAVGNAAADVREALTRVWAGVRALAIGVQPMQPRIWAT